MGEQDVLKVFGVSGEWIWGNDLGTIVFAQAFEHEKTLIFVSQHKRCIPEPTLYAHGNIAGDCYSLGRMQRQIYS
jgi:hypothetical protein